MSLCTLCSEIALRNYDRPQIFWEFISMILVNVSIFPNPQRQDIDSNLKQILAGQFPTKFEKFNESLKTIVERKPKKIAYIQSIAHYLLLELCLNFCHKHHELMGFDTIIKYALEFINESSMGILSGLLHMIQETLNSHRSTNAE